MSYYRHETAVIYPGVVIEDGAYIGPFCMIGGTPEIKGYTGPQAGVIIRTGAVLEGFVTIDAGSERPTEVKAAYLMKKAHVGHDALIMNNAVLSPGAIVGGHSIVWDYAVLGMGAAIHQKHEIAPGAMLGALSFLPKKVITEPFTIYIGSGQRQRENSKLLNSLTIDEAAALVAKWEAR